jgi:hypothetical protein
VEQARMKTKKRESHVLVDHLVSAQPRRDHSVSFVEKKCLALRLVPDPSFREPVLLEVV